MSIRSSALVGLIVAVLVTVTAPAAWGEPVGSSGLPSGVPAVLTSGGGFADVAPPESRETSTTSTTTRTASTGGRTEPGSRDAVTQAQLAEVNSELDRTRSTATVALALAVLALLLAVIGVVLARTGRRRPG